MYNELRLSVLSMTCHLEDTMRHTLKCFVKTLYFNNEAACWSPVQLQHKVFFFSRVNFKISCTLFYNLWPTSLFVVEVWLHNCAFMLCRKI